MQEIIDKLYNLQKEFEHARKRVPPSEFILELLSISLQNTIQELEEKYRLLKAEINYMSEIDVDSLDS